MIVVMQPQADEDQIQRVIDRLIELGFDVHRSTGEETTVIGALGVKKEFDAAQIEILEGVREVVRISQPYKLASRRFRSEGTVIDLGGGVRWGGREVVVGAGPGAIESAAQIERIAAGVARAGARILRGGVFRRHGASPAATGAKAAAVPGWALLGEAAARHGLRAAGEARATADVPALVDSLDLVEIGARHMLDDDLLDALGAVRKPVLLERGTGATVEEWLLAADRILAGGNYQLALAERGIRTFEPSTHATLDLAAIPAVHRLSHLPIVVDPSRAASRRDQVAPLARAAIAAGADGLFLEVHHDPDHAMVEGAQSLSLEQFETLMRELGEIAAAIGRRLA